ncbi:MULTISPECIES: SDR family oxidoreductase [unclassified Streptomyces]|uniref:SDR family NAD(P)-dependent oxidoreductase n=1 Tax=unclassified Streptomyces TaxID=2593676 RepID=UPI001E324369|nr:SDR family oxidoreductase [Streptomyces sp. MBT42]MCD2468707.1 SDR family oxidoreductase [Streptomyces sp. MBT42]
MDEDARKYGAQTERLPVLVVGGSRGIGRASAVALHGAGHPVVAWSRSVREGASDPAMRGIARAAVDVREPDAVAAEFTRSADAGRRPEVLVYSAATVGRGTVGTIGARTWRDTLEVNAVGAHTVLDQYLRAFGRHPSRVIGLTSEAALFPAAGRSAYAASKAALGTFLEAYREEARGFGTLVTVLYLGKVNTTLSRRSTADNMRALQPPDVAQVLVCLLELAPHVEVRSLEVTSVRSKYG